MAAMVREIWYSVMEYAGSLSGRPPGPRDGRDGRCGRPNRAYRATRVTKAIRAGRTGGAGLGARVNAEREAGARSCALPAAPGFIRGHFPDEGVVLAHLFIEKAHFAEKADGLFRAGHEAVEAAQATAFLPAFPGAQQPDGIEAQGAILPAYPAAPVRFAALRVETQALAAHFLLAKHVLAQAGLEQELAEPVRAREVGEKPGVAHGQEIFLAGGVMDEGSQGTGLGRGEGGA